MSLHPVRTLVLLYSMFAVGVINGQERKLGSQVSGLCVCVMVGYGLRVVTGDVNALEKGTSPPFYRPRGERLHGGRREIRGRANPDPDLSCVPRPTVGPVDLP